MKNSIGLECIMDRAKLKLLHGEESWVRSKLEMFEGVSTEALIESLRTDTEGALRVRPDGTVLNGNHRLYILKERGVDIDSLPREIVEYNELD